MLVPITDFQAKKKNCFEATELKICKLWKLREKNLKPWLEVTYIQGYRKKNKTGLKCCLRVM